MPSLDFSNESVKLVLCLQFRLNFSNFLRASYISGILNKEEEIMCWAIRIFKNLTEVFLDLPFE